MPETAYDVLERLRGNYGNRDNVERCANELESIIDDLTRRLAEKDAEIERLKLNYREVLDTFLNALAKLFDYAETAECELAVMRRALEIAIIIKGWPGDFGNEPQAYIDRARAEQDAKKGENDA